MPRSPWVLAFLCLLAGCSRPKAEQKPAPLPSAEPPPAASAAPGAERPAWPEQAATRAEPTEAPLAAGEGRAGSTLALATVKGRKVALIADADRGLLLVVDREKQELVGKARLSGEPSQLVVRRRDGRVYVALRDRNRVQAYEVQEDLSLTLRGEILTGVEPVGLALTPDESTLLVTTGWGHQLGGVSFPSRDEVFRVDLPREPRAVAVAGGKVFVAHVVGSKLSVFNLRPDGTVELAPRTLPLEGRSIETIFPSDLSPADVLLSFDTTGDPGRARDHMLAGGNEPAGKRRQAVQGYALAPLGERLFAPFVLVDPGPANRPVSSSYGISGPIPPEVSVVVALSMKDEKAVPESLIVTGQASARPCLLPRAAVAREGTPGQPRVLVACQGIDAVVEFDGKSNNPVVAEQRRWAVPAGPTGMAVDPQTEEALVWSQFDRKLSQFSVAKPIKWAKPAEKKEAVTSLALPGDEPGARGLSEEAQLGRRLFHATSDPRISRDGRGCASCHPDGRDDALTWASPDGTRNTPMLAGRLKETEPFSWNGNHGSFKEHLKQTLSRLGGRGLSEEDTARLQTYILAMSTPVRPSLVTDATIARGRELFRSPETLCSQCHAERAPFTDKQVHDVSSGAALDTPSLLFVGGTAPYFHDGRYATLREMLLDCDGKMGNTKHLSPGDLDALECYLGSL